MAMLSNGRNYHDEIRYQHQLKRVKINLYELDLKVHFLWAIVAVTYLSLRRSENKVEMETTQTVFVHTAV